jgi:hypothetical protein
MIEKRKFDKEGFLNLFGIWKDKSEGEIFGVSKKLGVRA